MEEKLLKIFVEWLNWMDSNQRTCINVTIEGVCMDVHKGSHPADLIRIWELEVKVKDLQRKLGLL